VLAVRAPTLEACRAELADATCLPVVHEGELVAVLAVTLPSGVRLPDVEARLLEELAGHAGLLVANARLTQGLAHQLDVVAARGHELRESRMKVVQVQDAARRRLERDIHDGAQQELVALVLQLAMAQRQRQTSPDTVASIRTSLSTAMRTLQDVVAGRTEDLVEARGLGAALEDVAILARSAGLEVRVRCRLPEGTPSDLAATVYFCVREAVQNVTKHARARRLDVVVEFDSGWVSWSVADDGVGVDGDAGRGRGLANLRERVTGCGGSVRIGPAREDAGRPGTLVTGRLPLAAQVTVLAAEDGR
jgi:signal transduction histidine kinase